MAAAGAGDLIRKIFGEVLKGHTKACRSDRVNDRFKGGL